MMLSSVLLPDPEGPISAQNSRAPARDRCRAAPRPRSACRGCSSCESLRGADRLSHGSPPPGPCASRAARGRRPQPARSASRAALRRRRASDRGRGKSGVPSGLRTSFAPQHDRGRAERAAGERAESPSAAPCSRNTRRIWPREAPIARRMPISFDFCTTETISTAAMPNATARPTKKRIAVLATICALIARKSCALVLIQLSASTPVPARIAARCPRRRRCRAP